MCAVLHFTPRRDCSHPSNQPTIHPSVWLFRSRQPVRSRPPISERTLPASAAAAPQKEHLMDKDSCCCCCCWWGMVVVDAIDGLQSICEGNPLRRIRFAAFSMRNKFLQHSSSSRGPSDETIHPSIHRYLMCLPPSSSAASGSHHIIYCGSNWSFSWRRVKRWKSKCSH